MNPQQADAFYNRGITRHRGREFEAAMEDFNKAIALNPRYAAAFTARAKIWEHWGKYDRANADRDRGKSLEQPGK